MIKRIKNRTICSLISRKSSCMKCYCHFVFLSFSFPSVRFSTPQFLLYFPYLRNSYCTFPYLRIYYCTLSLPPHFLLYFPCLRISYCTLSLPPHFLLHFFTISNLLLYFNFFTKISQQLYMRGYDIITLLFMICLLQ